MAIGDLLDVVNASKCQTVVNSFIKNDQVILNNTNLLSSMSSKDANAWQGTTGAAVPELTDTDQSNDESFDDEYDREEPASKDTDAFDHSVALGKKDESSFDESYERIRPAVNNDFLAQGPSSSTQAQKSQTAQTGMVTDNIMERQIVMKIIVRIVSNMLITKFPIDQCCNNRNNLIINNLIDFLEKVLSRSRLSLDQFLVGSLYLFRFVKNLNEADEGAKAAFKNNGDKLCLRRLIITSLVASSKHYRKNNLSSFLNNTNNNNNTNKPLSDFASSRKLPASKVTKSAGNSRLQLNNNIQTIKQRILNQNLNGEVWSLISGLPVSELTKLESDFNKCIAFDFNISVSELNKFKSELNVLIKLIIKSDQI